MERYNDYFDLNFSEKLEFKKYERKNLTKVYATNSLREILKKINQVEYGKTNSIEIYFDSQLKILPSKKTHEEIRRIRTFPNLNLKIPGIDCDYLWSHFLGEFSNFPFENEFELGIDVYTYIKLLDIKNKNTGFCYVNKGHFRHFKDHKFPELIDFSNDNSRKKRKTEEETKINYLENLIPRYL